MEQVNKNHRGTNMKSSRLIPLAVAGLLAATQMPLHAQDASRPAVQLAFGYECGDRFMVRNDGNEPIVIEYAVAGSQDRSQLHLNARQSAEIASAQNGNMELWVRGKVVASEPKGNRACNGTAAQGNGTVSVRPLDQSDNAAVAVAPQAETAAPVVVYPDPYDYYDYNDYYPYPYYGYYPYAGFSIYGRAPLGHGFGRVGGFGRGGIGRAGGGRGRR
jgi:hypothetical protein